MHAVGYRPRLSFLVLALATLGILAMVALQSPRTRSCRGKARFVKAQIECPHSRAYSVQLADAWYRGKRFDAAEQTIRDAAKCQPARVAEELHVIASFYHQLGYSYRRAVEDVFSTRTIEHLDWAIQFDAMLGGAHADELSLRKHRALSAIGPQ